MFKIESNIPLDIMAGARPKYPWRNMKVGDSVFFDGQNSQGNASVAAKMFGRMNGVKFASRSVDGGVRVWRIA